MKKRLFAVKSSINRISFCVHTRVQIWYPRHRVLVPQEVYISSHSDSFSFSFSLFVGVSSKTFFEILRSTLEVLQTGGDVEGMQEVEDEDDVSLYPTDFSL